MLIEQAWPWISSVLLLSLIVLSILVLYLRYQQKALQRVDQGWDHALTSSADRYCILDLDDRLVRANPAFLQALRVPPAQAIGQPMEILMHGEGGAAHCEVCRSRRAHQDAVFLHESGDLHVNMDYPIEISLRVIRTAEGEPSGTLQVMRSLSHDQKARLALAESEARFRHFSDAAFEGLVIHDQGVIVDVNQAVCEIVGYRREELIGQSVSSLVDETSQSLLLEDIEQLSDEPFMISGTHRDGSAFVAELRGRNLPMEGRQLRMIAVHDVTDLVSSNRDLMVLSERLSVTLESIGEAVIATDQQGRVEFMNPVASALTRWTVEEALGCPVAEVFSLLDDRATTEADPIGGCLQQDRVRNCHGDQILRRRDGSDIAVEHTATPIHDSEGHQAGAVLVFRDVSIMRDMADQLLYQASHDSLTGLINRGEFESRLRTSLKQAAQTQDHEDALCYLDLDQFKVVNDTCGHIAGDALLKQLSTLLLACLREEDVLARLGGDEFGVLLRNCGLAHAESVADSLRKTVREFRFVWQERTFDVGVSIGLVPIHRGSGSVTDLLSAADSACYVAKDQGRNRIQVYRQDDKVVANHQGEMQWVQRVSRAVERDRLVLYAQALVPLQDSGKDHRQHLEILVRMLDEEGGLVQPMAFIPAAERFDVMPMVDRWVVRETLAMMADQHRGQVLGNLACAINLSGQSLCDPTFLNYVLEQIRYHGIPAQNVCFEITETAAIANFSQAKHFLTEIRKQGSCFALDDFGSGLSSFGYLKNLPVDFLKIDGCFVRDMVEDPIDFAMVKSINEVGHVMGIRTIAEYVETPAIRDCLTQLGVDFAQGNAVGEVAPLDELLEQTLGKP